MIKAPRKTLSDEEWRILTENFPGLEERRPYIEKQTAEFVRMQTVVAKKDSLKPNERKKLMDDAAKKFGQAADCLALVGNLPGGMREIFEGTNFADDIDGRNEFSRQLISNLRFVEHCLHAAESRSMKQKPGPDNSYLDFYVHLIARFFRINGLGNRISAGEDSHSIKVFIKDLFTLYSFSPPDRALSDSIRRYQNNPW